MATLSNVLDPRGLMNDIPQASLAPRPADLTGKTIYIIESWPEKSGFEDAVARVTSYLSAKYDDIKFLYAKRVWYSSDDPALWAEVLSKADAYIYFAAPSCSTTAYAITWPARSLERKGLPGVVLIYEYLEADAIISQDREGMWIRYVKTPYPYEDNTEEEKNDIPRRLEQELLRPLEGRELDSGMRTPQQPPRYAPAGTAEDLHNYFYSQGWTDGLPIILPTEERVNAMLKGTSHSPGEVIVTNMAPEGRKVTVEKAAVTAVMAGAEPSYFPVILAAIEIMGRDQFYHATSKSTNSFSYLQVVNGPIRNEIGMNGSVYALGPGNKANAVIGRAHRLALINLGGAEVGKNLMGVQGNVSSYTFAIPENEEASPWCSYAVHQGFKPDESVLTILTGGLAHTGNYMLVEDGMEKCIEAIKRFEFNAGMTLLLAPQRARNLSEKCGCKTYNDVLNLVMKLSSMTIAELKECGIMRRVEQDIKLGQNTYPAEYLKLPDDALVEAYPRCETSIIVVGDPAGSDTIQGWALYRPRSTSIDKWR